MEAKKLPLRDFQSLYYIMQEEAKANAEDGSNVDASNKEATNATPNVAMGDIEEIIDEYS